MKTLLRIGSKGTSVNELQKLLLNAGYTISVDGIFGKDTETAIKDFQQKKGLIVDGIAGLRTLKTLKKTSSNYHHYLLSKKLTEIDVNQVAEMLDVEKPAIQAVYEVESRGEGFLPNGKPKIFFEGHIFWRQLRKVRRPPEIYVKDNEDILHANWTRDYYKKDQYKRLKKAIKIHKTSALASASWGTFQIMGFNYKICGFESVIDFVDAQYKNEGEHLKAFATFIKANKLVRHLQSKDWAAFARGYNGPGYAQNKYDIKMAEAYKKYKLL